MTEPALLEYAALRATIGTRGGLRPVAVLAGLGLWAAALLVVLAWVPSPMAALVPLVLLLGTFEVVRGLHLGVERIGRYLQAFHEEGPAGDRPPAPPAWEHLAMHFGPAVPGAGGHPLFVPVLALATLVNTLAILFPGPVMVEWTMLGVPHAAFLLWMLYCDRGMRRQRAADLARFRELKGRT